MGEGQCSLPFNAYAHPLLATAATMQQGPGGIQLAEGWEAIYVRGHDRFPALSLYLPRTSPYLVPTCIPLSTCPPHKRLAIQLGYKSWGWHGCRQAWAGHAPGLDTRGNAWRAVRALGTHH